MGQMLYNTVVLTPREVIDGGAVVVSKDGRITHVGPADEAPRGAGLRTDLGGRLVVPGFIDVHVHGGNGIRFGSSDQIAQDLQFYSEWVASKGVTGFLCSIGAPTAAALTQKVRVFADALDAGVEGAEVLGLHLEGPFLSKEKKGAMNPDWLRQPDRDEAKAVLRAGRGWIRQVTMAPELPGAGEVAALFREAGVVVALGHSNADYETASAALRGKFTHVTHTFNAQRGLHHRAPGVVGAVMASDNVTAELIADTIHVHPAAMKVLLRCLGTDRVVLITDANAAAGLPDGTYGLMTREITVKDGRATLPDGTIAGSTVTLDQCVRNIHQQVGVPLAEAVKMASLNPARAMGFAERLGSIAVGKDANLTVIDEDVNVTMSMVKGRVVYCNL